MSYFYDDNGNLKAELLDQKAQKTAKELVTPSTKNEKELKANQLRRFYNDCKNLERKFQFIRNDLVANHHRQDAETIALQRIYPRLKMIKSKLHYASNPKNPKIPKKFKSWLEENIDAIDPQQPRDFEAFILSFEALVGFCYGEGLSNN